MGIFIARRLVATVLMLVLVAAAVFSLGHLSGDPVILMVPEEATKEDIAVLRHALGFDRPLPVQFWDFISRAARADLGVSLRYRQPALALVLDRMPATLELSAAAMLLALVVAIPAALVSSTRPGTFIDTVVSVGTAVGQALPAYWTGLILIIVFAVEFSLLPATGRGGGLASLVLPAVTLGLWPMARITRVLRSSMLDVLSDDYVRTARAKGLSETVILIRHVARNASIPVITVTALTFGTLLGGTVITESVFAWPGIGRLALDAVYTRDFPLLQAVVLVVAVIFVAINFLTDLLYVWVDPRIRLR